MSDIQRKGRLAEQELQLTQEAHAAFREKCVNEAIALARLGERDKAYEKLLMVIAIDGVRATLQGHIDSATMDKASEAARHPNT